MVPTLSPQQNSRTFQDTFSFFFQGTIPHELNQTINKLGIFHIKIVKCLVLLAPRCPWELIYYWARWWCRPPHRRHPHHCHLSSFPSNHYSSKTTQHIFSKLYTKTGDTMQGFPLGKKFISQLATANLFLVASAYFWSPFGYWNFVFGRQCHFWPPQNFF